MLARLVDASQISGRRTRVLWYCGQCGEQNPGDIRHCRKCERDSIERHAAIHQSERAVCFRHPVTGEIRRPARADQPMPQVYADDEVVYDAGPVYVGPPPPYYYGGYGPYYRGYWGPRWGFGGGGGWGFRHRW